MFDRMNGLRPRALTLAVALALGLSGCGGGSNVRPTTQVAPQPPSFISDDVNVSFDGVTVGWYNNINGPGGVIKGGTGTLVLVGTDTYTGGTRINGGTLQIGKGDTRGSLTGDVVNNGTLVFDRSDNAGFNGDISGSGSLVQAGSGTLTLAGTDTYSGGTTIKSGSLRIGNHGTSGSLTGDVTDNGSLLFSRSDDMTFDGTISGSGSVVKFGDGKTTLTAANTYTGGTFVNGGTLAIAAGATVGPGDIKVNYQNPDYSPHYILEVDSGTLLPNHVVLATFGSTLDNAGIVGGAVDNPVEGITGSVLNHDGGIIEGNSVGVMLSESGSVSNDGVGSTIRSPEGNAIRMSGILSAIENTGGGTITSGSTAIYLQDGGRVTNGIGSTIQTTGTVDGDCQDTGNCSIFVESGGLALINAGTVIGNVQMLPTANNEITLSAGGSILGNLDVGTFEGSALTLNGDAGTIQLYSDAVTGTTTFTGHLTKSGDGTWIIDNDSLHSVNGTDSATDIYGGTLQVGNGGTEGSIGQDDIFIRDGNLIFDRSDVVTFQGDINGPDTFGRHASVIQAGSGTLILTGEVTSFVEKIIIESGTLQFGDGGLTDTVYDNLIASNVTDNGSLIIDHTADPYFVDGIISGTGSLTKNGSNTVILRASNEYTGGTTVNEGVLLTEKLLPGNIVVGASALLDGYVFSGTSPGVPGVAGNLSNAGTVAVHDGDSTVGGNYTQASTGTLAVSLGSKLDVAGTATLDGGTLEVTGADSGYVSNIHTDVLTAVGGVSGTFDQLVKDSGVVFTATTINYGTNDVWLDTTGLDITTAAAGAGVSYTPASMGSAVRVQGAFEQLDAKIAAGDSDSVSGAFLRSAGAFQQSPNLRAAQVSLESLSGELHAASAALTFEAIDASNRALSDRFDALLDARATAGMWMHDLDVGGSMARSGFDGIGFQLDGWMAGSDRRIGATGVAGFAFGQSHGRQQLDGRADRNRSRSTEGMLYAGWSSGHRYVQGRVGFGHYRQDVSRQLLLGSDYQGVGTDYNGRYNVAYGESGLHFERGGTQLTPFVDLQYARIDRDAFAEQGAGGFGLRAHAQVLDRWQAGFGVRAAHRWDFGGGRSLDLSARVEWQRTLAAHGDVFDASFVGIDQWQPLTGVGLSRRSAVFGLGLNAHLSDNTALKFGYDYGRGDRAESNMLTARLAVAF